MKSTARILFATGLCFFASGTCASENSIDAGLEKCLGSDSTTAHMLDCSYKAYDEWDKELNKNYNLLLSKLDPSEREILRNAQRQWLLSRDADFKAIDAVYAHKSGTLYAPMRVTDRTDIVKARALQLRGYVDLIDDSGGSQ
jgi:uncharacterized protein YecT (DUF1311 family)